MAKVIKWAGIGLAVFVVFRIMAGSGGSEQPKPPAAPAAAVNAVSTYAQSISPAPNTTKWTRDDIEFQLATIDRGSMIDGNDPVIDRYATALDKAEAKCTENRRFLGDIAVRATQLLKEDGKTASTMDILVGIDQAIPSGTGEMKCTEIAAAIVTLVSGR